MNDVVTQAPGPEVAGGRLLDALIIGSGVAGIEALHRLRTQKFDALAVDAADGVGGTWHWNRYPGARLDSESYSYGYFFSEELRNGWNWSEHFSSQEENESYFNYVVDALSLRPHIHLSTTIASALFDAADLSWVATTTEGRVYRARFLITGIGILSDPRYPRVPGREKFTGQSFHTARWPKEEVELRGKRVAVVGTGSSGVQAISAIGPEVGSLTVFQRSPNWCPPLNNEPLSSLEMAEIKGKYDAVWRHAQITRGGFLHGPVMTSANEYSKEERHAWYEHLYSDRRGFARLYTNFPEVIRTKEFNAEFSAFLEEKIRARVTDQSTADKLIPKDHGFGQKRPPFETNYYEVYNQSNVELIDTTEMPMLEVNETGIRTAQGQHDFDIIIYATGFNAFTGAFERIDIRGTGDVSLSEAWKARPMSWAGLATDGFPNLLMLGGPQSLGGNIPRALEKQTEFVSTLLSYMRDKGYSHVEITPEACAAWSEHIQEVVNMTLYTETDSWFWITDDGGNSSFGIYPAGIPEYGNRIRAMEADGYRGFVFSSCPTEERVLTPAGALSAEDDER